jgi:tRNA 2-thiouridine synthesizing protein E
MASQYPPGYQPELDDDGFLKDPALWDEDFARSLARIDGLGDLGPAHFSILRYLREHYLAHGALPPMKHVCRATHLPFHAVGDLFHGAREAWRLAGLPNPGEEAKSYMA